MDIKIIIFLAIAGIAIFSLIFYFVSKKIKNIKTEIFSLNEEINNLNSCKTVLKEEVAQCAQERETLKAKVNEEASLLNKLRIEKDGLSTNIQDLKKQAQDAADIFYEQTMQIANDRIEKDIDLAETHYQQAIDNCRKEYEKILTELNDDFKVSIKTKENDMSIISEDIKNALTQLNDLRTKMNVIIESKKIAEQQGFEKDYYRCIISEQDEAEIAKLRGIEPYFRNPRPICKIIWESYYKDSFSALLTRLLPEKTNISGIYKITNLTNDKVYIGQSVNLADRLRNHAKAGIGIDAPGLKLYQDMKKLGIENFSFEILEKCPQVELNNKEKYWIEFYHGQDFGYNITKGGSQKITS